MSLRCSPGGRSLAEVAKRLPKAWFFRIHRSYVVNLWKIRFLRKRTAAGREWEVKLEPPVNRVLPVSGGTFAALNARLEGRRTSG